MIIPLKLELPSHIRKVGTLYFEVKYSVEPFIIAEEARHQKAKLLFGEQHSISLDGKKAHELNAVLSMLHFFLDFFLDNACNLKFYVFMQIIVQARTRINLIWPALCYWTLR